MRLNRRQVMACLAVIAGFVVSDGYAQARATHVTSRCAVCHSELEFLRQNTSSTARARAVHVPDSIVGVSAHGALACTTCHGGVARFPHERLETKSCASCHEKANEPWLRGAHAAQAGESGADCAQCHGIHDVRSSAELKTKPGIAAMNRNCAGCHQAEQLNAASPHADSVLCASCHGPHDTRPSYDRDSRLWANQQLQTCGTCHEAITAVWSERDVHAQALLSRRAQKIGGQEIKHRPPTCTNCHGGHGMSVARDSTLVQAASDRCAECHDHYGGAYADSYHGQATELGSHKAAACADCHTAHSIQTADHPRSSIAKGNLARTCGNCHTGANAAFIKFDPHVDPHDADNPVVYWSYKLMNLLLIGTMSFFGLHTLLWLNRLSMDRWQARKRAERTPPRPGSDA
jgi:hypothetical protein